MRILCVALAASLAITAASAAATLDTVRQRGALVCGVSQGLAGFSNPDAQGRWAGLDTDICRAVAAAVLGDAKKARFVPLSSKESFTALQSGAVDLLTRNTTWTQTRDTVLGLNFVATIFYDGQGFMVRRGVGVDSAEQLDGATVCVNAGTTTELNLADYFRARKMRYTPVVFEKSDEVLAAYQAGRCDAYTTDQSGLYAQRLKLRDRNAHTILPDVISKEPLGPVVRQGDDPWFDIVRWTVFALIDAEELGVRQTNVDEMRTASADPRIRRLLGAEGRAGANMGLDAEWALRAIRQVGNYGELFDRHLGKGSPLMIDRGMNRLWNKGGLLYAPPIR
jgi:general L-amino acid transport system substrate-binding protein